MKEIKSIRIWQLLTGLLVLCNIGLLATLWLKQGFGVGTGIGMRPPNAPPTNGVGPINFVIEKIGFSNEQVTKYDLLITEHKTAMNKYKKEGKELREQLYSLLKTENKNEQLIDSIATQIANNQKQIELYTYHHFAAVRNLCNPTQKTEFDNVLLDVLKNMNRPAPPGGGGGGHPHGMHPPPPERER